MSSQYLFLFTVVASTTGFAVAVGLILFSFLLRRNLRGAGLFLFTTLGAAISTQALKQFFMVARPEGALIEAVGYAFPSGHAMGALYLTLFIAYTASSYRKTLRYSLYFLSAAFALAIGLSRLQLGVHTPLQVLAGYSIAAFWMGMYIFLDLRFSSKT